VSRKFLKSLEPNLPEGVLEELFLLGRILGLSMMIIPEHLTLTNLRRQLRISDLSLVIQRLKLLSRLSIGMEMGRLIMMSSSDR
jgi:hypothetical protein